MKHLKLISVLSIFFLSNYSGYSQYNFKRGMIITNNYDTIYGFIDGTVPEISYKNCFFKKDSLSEVEQYTPQDLKAYIIFDYKYYVSKRVTVDYISDYFFLEYLLEGVVNLYYVGGNLKDLYFFEKNNKMYELTNEERESLVDGKTVTINSNKYIGILNFLMSDANGMQREINSTKFNHLSLIQVTKDYHNLVCTDKSCVVYYKKQIKLNDIKIKIKYGIMVDFVWSFLNMEPTISKNSNSTTNGYYNYTGFAIKDANGIATSTYNLQAKQITPGIFVNFNRNKRLSLQLELKYQDLKYSGISFKKIQLPVFVSYDLNRYKRVIPYLSIGIANNFYFDVKNENIYVEYNTLSKHSVEEYPFNPIYSKNYLYFQGKNIINHNFNMSMVIGCGARIILNKGNYISIGVMNSSSFIKNKSSYGSREGVTNSKINSKIYDYSLSIKYAF